MTVFCNIRKNVYDVSVGLARRGYPGAARGREPGRRWRPRYLRPTQEHGGGQYVLHTKTIVGIFCFGQL